LRRVGADWDLSDMNFLLGSRTMRNRPVLSFELPSIATSRSHHSLVSLAALPLAQHLEKHQATSQHDSARAPEGRDRSPDCAQWKKHFLRWRLRRRHVPHCLLPPRWRFFTNVICRRGIPRRLAHGIPLLPHRLNTNRAPAAYT